MNKPPRASPGHRPLHCRRVSSAPTSSRLDAVLWHQASPSPTRKRALGWPLKARLRHNTAPADALASHRTADAGEALFARVALTDPRSHSKAGAAMASPAASFVSYREPTRPLVNNDLGSPTRLFQGTDQALASAIIASKPTRAVNKRCSELNYRATLSNRSLPPKSCRSRRQPEAEALRHLKRSVASTDDVSLSGPRVKA